MFQTEVEQKIHAHFSSVTFFENHSVYEVIL